MEEVNSLSSHMNVVTPTRAVVTYRWGDFKHDPLSEIKMLISQKQPKAYDLAVGLLIKLHDLAVYQEQLPEFNQRIRDIRARYGRLYSLMERLDKAKLGA